MMNAYKLLYSSIVAALCSFGGALVTNNEELEAYITEYKKWETLYRGSQSYVFCEYTECLTMVNKKYDKLAEMFVELENTKLRYPITIVNLYTQQLPKIYSRVNHHLVFGTDEYVWEMYANLLSKAIDILSKLLYGNRSHTFTVYRGQSCEYPVSDIGKLYSFGRFLSTTLKPSVALAFPMGGNCKTFIKIENATGLPVKFFSSFPGEEEILLDYRAVFSVKNVLNDSEKHDMVVKQNIYEEIQDIIPGGRKVPDVFVHLMMIDTVPEIDENLNKRELRNRRSSMTKEYTIGLETIPTVSDRRIAEAIIREDEEWERYLRLRGMGTRG